MIQAEQGPHLVDHWVGPACMVLFGLAYLAVMGEDRLHLRKSIPVMVAAGLIWILIGGVYVQLGDTHTAAEAVRRHLLDYAELFLFLVVAMTFINTLEERGVFQSLRAWLVARQYTLRTLFWLTGLLAFWMSPIADNLTTALVMGAVVMAVGRQSPRFVVVACINIVVAANAGGVFSPFGDITTLMVWQAGVVSFTGFFALLLPSLVNWLIPAAIMSAAVDHERPGPVEETVRLKSGAKAIVALFGATIAMAVIFHQVFHLPPVLGMMTGLGGLKLFAYWQGRRGVPVNEPDDVFASPVTVTERPFDVFRQMERVEWDTLMFFYGVILGVGGLGTLGYLAIFSQVMYGDWGATTANVLIGLMSAVVDNIPVMFAVLAMNPDMSHGQWLLVTLTAGAGGSLLSVGSAAGVALMGQARGIYTFRSHVKWAWAIALGYAASIGVHFWVNARHF